MTESSFGVREVARLTGLSEHRVRAMARAGLVGSRGPRRACGGAPRAQKPCQDSEKRTAAPTDRTITERRPLRFNFFDLKVLRMAAGLLARGLQLGRTTRALTLLKRQAALRRLPLTGATVTEKEGRVLASDGSSVWDIEAGQTVDEGANAASTRLQPAVTSWLGKKNLTADSEDPSPRISDAPRLPMHDALDSADLFFEQALQLEEAFPARAFALYLRALACDPEHVEALINAGRLCSADNDPNRALRYFRLATRIDNAHAVAHFNLAVTLHDMGDVDQAVEAYRKTLLHDPHFADAHYNLGCLLEEGGETQEAFRHFVAFRSALEQNPPS